MENRNLSILFTDMKGFTLRTSSQSRDETLQMIKRHKEILMPVIERRGGRLIKTIGDAFLVVFESPTEAVLAGVDLQETLRKHNASAPPQEKIEVRAAVNSGEVMMEEGDVYGEAVNIASRVQNVAEPNEVYFTEATYLSMNKSEVPSSEIGYRILKGLPQKIKLYKVLRENDKSGASAHAFTTIVPTGKRAAAFLIDLLLLTFVMALIFGVPFSLQSGKEKKVRAKAASWTRATSETVAKKTSKADTVRKEIETLQKEINDARTQISVKRRDLEAAQIDLDQQRKLLDRDQELFDKKSEANENASTDEGLIKEETALRKRGNDLDKQQDLMGQNGEELDRDEEKISAKEELVQQKTDALNEQSEVQEETANVLPPEAVKAVLWGSGPVPENFPRYEEVEAFRSERNAEAKGGHLLRFAFLITAALLFLIYQTAFLIAKGATPGKQLLHLEVCNEDGKPVSPFRAFLRSFCYFISALPLGLGFFWVQVDARHRAWHDKFSRTKVISN